MDILIYLLLLVGMYLLLVRPQQRKLKERRRLVASVAVGDEIVSAGGIIGTIRVLTDDQVHLEVADGIEVRILRGAISGRLNTPVDRDVERDIERDSDLEPGAGRDDDR